MRLIRSHDSSHQDRSLSDEEIGAAITQAETDRREWIALGELDLASICQRAVDRMLDTLSERRAASHASRGAGG